MIRSTIALIAVVFCINLSDAQSGMSPYPVIFVHGLNSDDQTWNTVTAQLSTVWEMNEDHTLHFVLNARGGDTTLYMQDVLSPLRDAGGNIVNVIGASDIYTVNFGNFWNRNPSDPRIILYSNTTPGSSQSPGNQSAISKQAFALSIAIDSVLRITGAEKVILVGHSMGGLAIREYLQRTENGSPKWWIDPQDTVIGHKVAKVVTTGTPHLGTNVTSIPLFTIDNNSEAMRDMRISYTNGQAGAYLFSNNELNVTTNFYNRDIDCNNLTGDQVSGISSGNSFNSALPLPPNVIYTYITSNYLGLGTDLAVSTSRQWLYSGSQPQPAGIADTLYNTRNHLQQTSDVRSIIRGLDEPDRKEFAYRISTGITYSACITAQSFGSNSDTDVYRFNLNSGGKLKLKAVSSGAGVSTIALLGSSGSVLAGKNFTGTADSVLLDASAGIHFARITGNSNLNTGQAFHDFTVEFIPNLVLDLRVLAEGLWNGTAMIPDTMRVYLRNSASPYGIADSSLMMTDGSGNAVFEFAGAEEGSYYIQLKHRNALETWSSAPVLFSRTSSAEFDFTQTQNSAFGGNMTLKGGLWCIFSGDADGDGTIDATDLALIDNDALNFATGYLRSDIDGNGFIDATDYSVADNNASAYVSAVRP
ncbi:MAG: hypothetical protein K1X85_08965 [Ignavibacteria bacterium]|nr:hypothetical protein [Ignavibacteria bacterium]